MKLDNSRTFSTAKRSLFAAFSLAASLLASIVAPAVPAQAAAIAVPAPAPATYTCLYYTVKPGDQLLRIAIRYGTTTEILMRVNGMRTNRVYIGQRLCIPRNTPPKPPPGPGPAPQPGAGPWYGEYWNNITQAGASSLARTDAAVNFNWGYGTPDAGRVFADNFSARWTRNFVSPYGGVYRFSATHDDGVRVWLDGNPVIDQFGFTGSTTSAKDVYVAPGTHTLRVDYAERGGIALIRFSYVLLYIGQPLPNPPTDPVPGAFPCSNAGIGVSNLCIEQPYPVPRGGTAYAVWRIATGFRYGEFDRGDGAGYRGPIASEQRIEIPGITGPRTVRLRWLDGNGNWRYDSFLIQVY